MTEQQALKAPGLHSLTCGTPKQATAYACWKSLASIYRYTVLVRGTSTVESTTPLRLITRVPLQLITSPPMNYCDFGGARGQEAAVVWQPFAKDILQLLSVCVNQGWESGRNFSLGRHFLRLLVRRDGPTSEYVMKIHALGLKWSASKRLAGSPIVVDVWSQHIATTTPSKSTTAPYTS